MIKQYQPVVQIQNLIKTLKIKHYIKNIIILLPLFFSMNLLNVNLWLKEIVMIISFCLISSAVYVMNDLIDIEKDKLHPIKSLRPIASGAISKLQAIIILLLLFVFSTIFACKLNILCLILVLSYFVLNVIYSFWLKKMAIIDVASIALGFILRIVAGCYAICVIPSPLVILMTFFASMFFSCAKRKLELQVTENSNCREALKELDIHTISQFILMNAVLSIAFYFAYVLDAATIERAGTNYLYLTVIPFTLMVYRLFLLINTTKIDDDPIHYLENDKTIKWLFVLYMITLIIVITILK